MSATLGSKTKKEYLQDLKTKYLKEVKPDEWTMRDVADWAISKDLWDEPPESKSKRCANELSAACREEYHTDTQGRKVRSNHHYAVTVTSPDGSKTQKHFWASHQDMTKRQAKLSFGQRRKQIEGECVQLHTDISSYNDNNKNNDYYQTSFDFTYCVEESTGSDDYDPS